MSQKFHFRTKELTLGQTHMILVSLEGREDCLKMVEMLCLGMTKDKYVVNVNDRTMLQSVQHLGHSPLERRRRITQPEGHDGPLP